MLRTRREILDRFLKRMNDEGDSVSRDLAEQLLDDAVLVIWQAHPFKDHRLPADLVITLLAGQRIYPLPNYFGRVVPKTERLPNLTTGRWLTWMSEDELRASYPLQGALHDIPGVPDSAALSGPVGCRVQPTPPGQALEVTSTSDDDSAFVRVAIEGVRPSGEWDEVQVTLTPPTPVSVGSWSRVINFSKAYPAGLAPTTENTSSVGTVTLRVAGPGTVLETLLPWESGKEYPSLLIGPTPNSTGEQISLPAIRRPRRYTNDAQEVPADWGPAILEEMAAHYQETDGDTSSAANLPRPMLLRLIGLDNTKHAPNRIKKRAFDPYGILG